MPLQRSPEQKMLNLIKFFLKKNLDPEVKTITLPDPNGGFITKPKTAKEIAEQKENSKK
jgi:hypothetical protein